MESRFIKHFSAAAIINVVNLFFVFFLYIISQAYYGTLYAWLIGTVVIFCGGMMLRMKDTKNIVDGVVARLIYMFVGLMFSVIFLMFFVYFSGYFESGWHMLFAVDFFFIAVIIAISNSRKREKADSKIKIDLKHIIYSLIMAIVVVFLSWLFIFVMGYNARALWMLTVPILIICGLYFFMRNTKGFVNGLLNGLIYYIITNAVFYFAYEYFFKSFKRLPFYIDPKLVMITTIGLLLLTGVIGWINSLEKDVDFFEFLSKASVSEEIVTEGKEDKNED